jgi:hypothetical protein
MILPWLHRQREFLSLCWGRFFLVWVTRRPRHGWPCCGIYAGTLLVRFGPFVIGWL